MTAGPEPTPRTALDDVELLPEATGDDTAAGWGEAGGGFTDDDWRAERPPHHEPH